MKIESHNIVDLNGACSFIQKWTLCADYPLRISTFDYYKKIS